MKYRTLGTSLGRDFRNDLNANFGDIDNDIQTLGAGAKQAVEAAVNANEKAEFALEQGELAKTRLEELNEVDAVQFKDRQDNFDAQLAHTDQQVIDLQSNKSDKVYVDSELNKKANQTDVRLKSTPIGLNDADADLLTAIQGGTTVEVLSIPRDSSVTPWKTTFFKRTVNMFNKATVTENMVLNPSSGASSSNTEHDTSDFIEVSPSQTYVKNFRGHVLFFDVNKTFISGISDSISRVGVTFDAPANCVYLRVTVRKMASGSPTLYNKEMAQLEKGNVVTPYNPYTIFDLEEIPPIPVTKITGRFSESNIGFLIPSANLFNKNTVSFNTLINPNGGSLSNNQDHDASDFIAVNPTENYIKNVKGHVVFYNAEKAWISGINQNDIGGGSGEVFVTPVNCEYLRFTVNKTVTGQNIQMTQLQKGTQLTEYEDFGIYKIDETKIKSTQSLNKETIVNLYESYKYANKKWGLLGDSITGANKYQVYSNQKLQFGQVVTKAIGGTTLCDPTETNPNAFVNRYLEVDADCDVVTIMGGTNDFGQSRPIESEDLYDRKTFKGALREIIEGFQSRNPQTRIICITPPPRDTETPLNGVNGRGFTVKDYVNAMKDVCSEYSVPVVDLYSNLGINKFNMNEYMPDRVHPNDEGHKRIAALIISWLNFL